MGHRFDSCRLHSRKLLEEVVSKDLQREKKELLLAMYASVVRMNKHTIEGNLDSIQAERYLQINLRNNFETFLQNKTNLSGLV